MITVVPAVVSVFVAFDGGAGGGGGVVHLLMIKERELRGGGWGKWICIY